MPTNRPTMFLCQYAFFDLPELKYLVLCPLGNGTWDSDLIPILLRKTNTVK